MSYIRDTNSHSVQKHGYILDHLLTNTTKRACWQKKKKKRTNKHMWLNYLYMGILNVEESDFGSPRVANITSQVQGRRESQN